MSMARIWTSRLAWLLMIWAGSVAGLFLVAWLLRLLMRGAGMST